MGKVVINAVDCEVIEILVNLQFINISFFNSCMCEIGLKMNNTLNKHTHSLFIAASFHNGI